jgi:hypothetical protein
METSHILQKTNLLLSFEIARKISPKDITDIKRKVGKVKGSKNKKVEFEKEMENLTESILGKETVPGLLNKKLVNQHKTNKLMQLGIDIGKDIQDLKLSKKDESFLILSIIKLLELSITDFENWSSGNGDEEEDSTDDN